MFVRLSIRYECRCLCLSRRFVLVTLYLCRLGAEVTKRHWQTRDIHTAGHYKYAQNHCFTRLWPLMSERNFLIPISLFLDFHHYTGNKTLDQRDHYGGLKPDKLVEEEKQVVAFLVPSGLQRRTPPMLCLFGFLKIKFCPHIREQWLPFTLISWACHGEDRFELHEIWSTNTEKENIGAFGPAHWKYPDTWQKDRCGCKRYKECKRNQLCSLTQGHLEKMFLCR